MFQFEEKRPELTTASKSVMAVLIEKAISEVGERQFAAHLAEITSDRRLRENAVEHVINACFGEKAILFGSEDVTLSKSSILLQISRAWNNGECNGEVNRVDIYEYQGFNSATHHIYVKKSATWQKENNQLREVKHLQGRTIIPAETTWWMLEENDSLLSVLDELFKTTPIPADTI